MKIREITHCRGQVTVFLLVRAFSIIFLLSSLALAGGVQAVSNLNTPGGGPFPSDRFTVADSSQNTGLRVNLPKPDCLIQPSNCADLEVINTLDGFSLQPRLSIPFSGSIDITTVSSQTVFLVNLGNTLPGPDHIGSVVGINQIAWDPVTSTLHAESDEFLEQHTRYGLIVTRGVKDENGDPVEPTETFRRFLAAGEGEYRNALLKAVEAAARTRIAPSDVVVASAFTTQSVTAILEKIRDQIKASTPAPADFLLGRGGVPTVFALDDVASIANNQQTGDNPPRFTSVQVNVGLLRMFPGAIGQIAFGKYLSPDYEVHPGEYMPRVGTLTEAPEARAINEIYFNLYLPSGPKPPAGWPVAIFGHGANSSKNSGANVAASMAAQGIATIAINVIGYDFGPLGTLTVSLNSGSSVTFPSGGRGWDQNGDGIVGSGEGLWAAPPRDTIGPGDGLRQTAVDLMQLVRVIEVGMDVDGDGSPDLDPSRIYCFSASLGGDFAAPFTAIDPRVRAAVFSSAGVSVGSRRLSPASRGPLIGAPLASRLPPLLNSPDITQIGDVPVSRPYFDENFPLRNQPPVINTVPGAMEIQAVMENWEWVQQSGEPAAYARYLRRDPLEGMPPKSVIFQFAKGDQTVPNPAMTAILRAGDLADRATYYRHDLAFSANPALPKDPHNFTTGFVATPATGGIARAAQQQIAVFFASDGFNVINPDSLFEVPIVLPLPEELSFIP